MTRMQSPFGLLIALMVVGCSLAGCMGDSAGSTTYIVQLTGSMTSVEQVGSPTRLDITARNLGDALPHLVLDLAGLGSWDVSTVIGCNGPVTPIDGAGNSYDFGPVAAGETCDVSLDLVARHTGTPTLSLTAYSNLTSDERMDTDARINNPEATVALRPSITP
jgi:hypothetical protein